MKRRLRILALVVLTVLTVSSAAGWIRSYLVHDEFQLMRVLHNDAQSRQIDYWALAQSKGSIAISTVYLVENSARQTLFIQRPGLSCVQSIPAHIPDANQLGFGLDYRHEVNSYGMTTRSVVAVPHWFLLLLFGTWPASVAYRRQHRSRHFAAGRCPKCGYDLRATPDRCPECGTAAVNTPA